MAPREKIIEQAMALSVEDRLFVVDTLDRSLSLGVPGTSLTPAEVTAELLRRIKSLDSGATVAEDADDVMRQVDEALDEMDRQRADR